MGHRFLYQPDAAGRIGAILARSQDSLGCREKVEVGGSDVARGSPECPSKFAILKDSARYPSGPRERSAKPPFVGSNPTRASKLSRFKSMDYNFRFFPVIPNLGTFGNNWKKSLC